MEQHKVALLILTTSKNRDNWVTIKDTYIFNMTLKTFLLTQSKEHNYIFYIGIDNNDRIFDNSNNQMNIIRMSTVFKNVIFKFITMDNIQKGHVTKMWNKLHDIAYDENCDYFYQCGDDINFKTKDWINSCISILKKNNDIGLTGPINNNARILTQAFVSRKHKEIFGFLFPEEIKNWCCDDWYNLVYKPNHFYPLTNHYCSNDGGNPRYDINNDKKFTNKNFRENVIKLREDTAKLAEKHKKLISV